MKFLEDIDRIIGKDHLLKNSVIMIKAWFMYEASLLGSHAACMATYALYVLVVFILNNFYEELSTPLDVFYKFFEYFGQFEWDQ